MHDENVFQEKRELEDRIGQLDVADLRVARLLGRAAGA